MDYVYNPSSDLDEFCNVHVSIKTTSDKLEVLLVADNEMTREDVEGILRTLEKDFCKRSRVNLAEECTVSVEAEGRAYGVSLEGSPVTVLGVTPKASE
jgi:hypothetical protein